MSWTNIEFSTWMSDYIIQKLWDMIIHTFLVFNADVVSRRSCKSLWINIANPKHDGYYFKSPGEDGLT